VPARLTDYERKRHLEATPEPAGAAKAKRARRHSPRFVVQEHHARRLHWDFRLERDGVLVSWAVPRGIPPDPKRNHLAVHVEDHPLDYMFFEGEIPRGNYGAGQVTVWDHGTYEEHKWTEREVMVTLHGGRVEGRYVLFQTDGKNWMIHRMDPPQDRHREPMPELVVPMLARLSANLPRDDDRWGYEFKWDGIRAVMHCSGGRMRLQSRKLEDVTRRYPELGGLCEQSQGRELVVDGEVIALDATGRPSFEALQERMGLNTDAEVKRKAREVPVFYMIFDVLYLDGRSTMGLPYRDRRNLLARLALKGGNWQTPDYQPGDGKTMLEASVNARLEGVVAKRLDSAYEPGRRTGDWLKVKNHQRQELVIGGWLPGEGRRHGHVGALLVGYHEGDDFVYAGKVGTGFTDKTLAQLASLLEPRRRDTSPFTAGARPPRASIFVEPELVAEVEFTEWTQQGQLRHPSFKGMRNDKPAQQVVREVAG
jgi:bifunctional non-homologous end joining protein LigD